MENILLHLDYDNLQRDELIKFYDDYYINGKCALFIAGNLSNNIEALLNKHFGGLNLSGNKEIDY